MSAKRKRKRNPQRRVWQPLERAVAQNAERYTQFGISPPDATYVNDLYSVFVRFLGDGEGQSGETLRERGGIHISFHRHDRAAVRDWRHYQAIKNEIAGPDRTAVEIFPPESQLVDAANEYHLWVLPEGVPHPFTINVRNVMSHDEGVAQYGASKARQREWQPGLPTGKNLEVPA